MARFWGSLGKMPMATARPYQNRAAAFIVLRPAVSPGGGRLMGGLWTFGWEWGSALLRWLHVTAAIAWIGGGFFFMHLGTAVRKRRQEPPTLQSATGGG